MINSRVASKVQPTNTQPVRAAPALHSGQSIAYAIGPGTGCVVINRAAPSPAVVDDDPFAVFTAWGSPADSAACTGL